MEGGVSVQREPQQKKMSGRKTSKKKKMKGLGRSPLTLMLVRWGARTLAAVLRVKEFGRRKKKKGDGGGILGGMGGTYMATQNTEIGSTKKSMSRGGPSERRIEGATGAKKEKWGGE